MGALSFGDEVRRLHDLFQDWFAGRGDRTIGEFERALAPEFTIVSPNGSIRDRAGIVEAVERARGTHDVEIRIGAPIVRFDDGTTLVGSYEEHQRSEGAESVRRSAVVMRRDAAAPGGWSWILVHETWIRPPQASTPESR